MPRAGRLRSIDATRSWYRDLLVRELEDGTVEYLVGDAAHSKDGWALLHNTDDVQWDPPPVLHMHSPDDSCAESDCSWTGTEHERKTEGE